MAAMGSKKKGGVRDVVAKLTDDVLVDIISRVPVKSLGRCKMVCRRWRDLISHPEHRKRLLQTLEGFFCMSYDRNRSPKSARHFTNVSGAGEPLIDPSLSFLPKYESTDIVDSCNGLLLCCCWKPTDPMTVDSVVCNPATEKWVVVPDSGWSSKDRQEIENLVHVPGTGTFYKGRIARLAFDAAVSSHFHVFEFIPDDVWYMDDEEMKENNSFDGRIEVVAIYSSKAGVWSFNEHNFEWGDKFAMPMDSKSVFFNGVLHLTTYCMVVAIDLEGNILRGIPIPMPDYDEYNPGGVYVSQGHLYFSSIDVSDKSEDYELSVWVLEDYNSENWSLKYSVNPLYLFGATCHSKFGDDSIVISIHPEHDVIMIVMVCGAEKTLMSFDMCHMRRHFISRLGCHCSTRCIPYVPLLSGSLADEN